MKFLKITALLALATASVLSFSGCETKGSVSTGTSTGTVRTTGK